MCLFSILLISIGFTSTYAQNFGIQVNGVYFANGSTVEIGCLSGELQFTAIGNGSSKPSTQASFDYPSGWQLTQSIDDLNKKLQPDLTTGGIVKFSHVNLGSGNTIWFNVTVYINIVRPLPTNLSVTGDAFICDGQTKTYNLSGSQPGDQFSWSTNLSGSSNSTSLQVSKGSANGLSYVTANVTTANGCGTFSSSYNVWAGVPSIQTMTANGNIVYPNSTYDLCPSSAYNLGIDNQGSASSASWSIVDNTSGASIISSYPNSAQISSGSNQGSFSVQIALSNTCGSASPIPSYDFSVTSCGYRAYTVSPNPAKDEFAVDFESSMEEKNIPEQFDLIPESTYGSSKSVRTFDMRGETAINQAKSSRKLTFNVQDLPRGRYILRIMKEKEDKVETHRIVLQ